MSFWWIIVLVIALIFGGIFVYLTSTGKCIKHTAFSLIKFGLEPIYIIEDAVADIFDNRHTYFINKFQEIPQIKIILSKEITYDFSHFS